MLAVHSVCPSLFCYRETKPFFLEAKTSGFINFDSALLGSVPWFNMQIVGCLEPFLPGSTVNFDVLVDVARFQIHVAADRLVYPFLRSSRYLDKGVWTELKTCLVHVF